MWYDGLKPYVAAAALALTLVPADLDAAKVKKPAAKKSSYLRGSVAKENKIVNEYDLTRVEDDEMLQRFIDQKRLVLLCAHKCEASEKIPEKLRYVRPWTELLAERLSSQHASKYGSPLFVNSGVRTKEYQETLQARNGNAISPEKTTHTTGTTIDIAYKRNGKKIKGMLWMIQTLGYLQGKGLVQVAYEKYQPVFHVCVSPKYADYVASLNKAKPARTKVARAAKKSHASGRKH